MDSSVQVHHAVTKFQGSLRDAESGRGSVRRSGPPLKRSGSITGLDRRAGLDAGE